MDTCNSVSFSLPEDMNVGTTGSDLGVLTVPGYGSVFSYLENHSWFGPRVGPGSYGVNPSAYSVPAGTSLKFELTTYAGPDGSGGVTAVSWVEFNCTTGAVVGSYFGDGSYEAAPVPAGFQQHNLVCDSAVYDSPGGTPVGANMVHAGQAWFVSPTPTTGPDGQSWTEIFVAGPNDGYIPSSCVGGLTPFN